MVITYKRVLGIKAEAYHVLLDGRTVGTIKKLPEGYAYRTTARSVWGETFPTLSACKASLEAA